MGFPDGLSRDLCRREMDNYVEAKFPSYKPVFTEMYFKGEFGKKAPGRNGYAEFASRDVRDAALKILGKDPVLKVSGTDVNVKPAKTQRDWQRDNDLRDVSDKIKKHPSARGKSVEPRFGSERCVKVDGIVVYEQAKRGSAEPGKFAADFGDIQDP